MSIIDLPIEIVKTICDFAGLFDSPRLIYTCKSFASIKIFKLNDFRENIFVYKMFDKAYMNGFKSAYGGILDEDGDVEAVMAGLAYGGHVDLFKSNFTQPYLYNKMVIECAYGGGNRDIINMVGLTRRTTAIAGVCKSGNLDLFNELYSSEPVVTNLMEACYGGNIEIVKTIIANGCPDFKSCLFASVLGGSAEIIYYIYNYDQDLDGGLLAACVRGNIKLIDALLNIGAKLTQIHLYQACLSGHINVVKMLIDLGCEVNSVAAKYACMNNDIEMVKLILPLIPYTTCEMIEEAMEYEDNKVLDLILTKEVIEDCNSACFPMPFIFIDSEFLLSKGVPIKRGAKPLYHNFNDKLCFITRLDWGDLSN